MKKGNPDVASELWINAVREPLAKQCLKADCILLSRDQSPDLVKVGGVTEKFAKDHPDLNTVEKVLARPDLFPYAEDKSKGAFMGCPAGWGCQLTNANLFRAFEMEKKDGFSLIQVHRPAWMDRSLRHLREVKLGLATTGHQLPSSASTICKCYPLKLPLLDQTIGMVVWSRQSRTVLIRSQVHLDRIRSPHSCD